MEERSGVVTHELRHPVGEFVVDGDALLALVKLNEIVQAEHAVGNASDVVAVETATVTSALLGSWITALLEANFEPGEPLHPELAWCLEALEVPVYPDDPAAKEKLYRRWLAGLSPEWLSRELLLAFTSRWSSSGRADRDRR